MEKSHQTYKLSNDSMTIEVRIHFNEHIEIKAQNEP